MKQGGAEREGDSWRVVAEVRLSAVPTVVELFWLLIDA